MEEALVKRIMPHSLEAERPSSVHDHGPGCDPYGSEQLVMNDFNHQQ